MTSGIEKGLSSSNIRPDNLFPINLRKVEEMFKSDEMSDIFFALVVLAENAESKRPEILKIFSANKAQVLLQISFLSS